MRPMILVLSLVLGIVPLVGVVWIFVSGMITISPFSATVDGLFTTLILLALSLCFLLNAYWEARDHGLLKFLQKKKEAAAAKPATPTAAVPAGKAPAVKASS
ncbi:MAG TPA: hypothetical protein VGS05_14755 [Candidatus Sulfotelmatobacter sp.]|nr:hypothetical protein [Candidatus Sulfotelmatobacter sp.]